MLGKGSSLVVQVAMQRIIDAQQEYIQALELQAAEMASMLPCSAERDREPSAIKDDRIEEVGIYLKNTAVT